MQYIAIIFLLTFAQVTHCQNYKYTYYFDGELRPASKGDALIVGRGVKTTNGITVDFFATKTGGKLFTTDFTDSTLNFMHGRNIEYDKKGRPVISNFYKNNILDGLMQKWDTDGRMTDSLIYGNGTMLNKTKFHYTKSGSIVKKDFIDSANNIMQVTFLDTAGSKSSEVIFTGEKGVWNYYKNGSIYKTDSVFTRIEKDASYPGGPEAWRKHLEKNMDGLVTVRNGAPPGNYTPIIQFMVDTDGKISDIKALTNIGYGTEDEAIRVIKKSGKWIPAVQFGKNVKAYRKQPLTFQVIDNRNRTFR